MMDQIKSFGSVDVLIEWDNGKKEKRCLTNKILRVGRISQAKAISNQFGGVFDLYVNSMSFGSGGTVAGTPRVVDDTRTGLFGPTILTKGIISTINPDLPTEVVFTSVVTFDEAVGQVINEMGLKMKSNDFFSMVTFGDITKTSGIQLVFNWSISFLG